MKQALIGILILLTVTLCGVVLYVGLLTLLIRPGETRQAGAFTIERPLYWDGPKGKMTPVAIEESGEVMTYTFIVRKGD